jgi:hypothetical protein
MNHEFHFIMREETYSELNKLSGELNKSLSKTISFVFEKMFVLTERHHLMSKEKQSMYLKVSDDDNEERVHIHAYMKHQIYRKLKQIHQDLNTYSMAQIMRRVIEVFLKGCKDYGVKRFIEKIEKISKTWDEKKKIYREEKRIFLRHLSYIVERKSYCMTGYDTYSSAFSIQLVE